MPTHRFVKTAISRRLRKSCISVRSKSRTAGLVAAQLEIRRPPWLGLQTSRSMGTRSALPSWESWKRKGLFGSPAPIIPSIDIGKRSPAVPVTPPYVRVRSRRLEDPVYVLCTNGVVEPVRISRYCPGMRIKPMFLAWGLGILLLSAAVGSDRFHRVGPPEIYPDPIRASDAANPHIKQQNIRDTVCSRQGSTRSIRPPSRYASKLKRRQLRE